MVRKSPAEHANDHQYERKTGLDGKAYASLPDKNKVFKWKLISEDLVNAVDKYKFWHPLEHEKDLKYDYKDALKQLKLLEKELKKIGVAFYYLDRMGRSGNHDRYFPEYTASDVFRRLHGDGYDIDKQSVVFLDDIQVLRALLNGKLGVHHWLMEKDVKNVKSVFAKVFKGKVKYASRPEVFSMMWIHPKTNELDDLKWNTSIEVELKLKAKSKKVKT